MTWNSFRKSFSNVLSAVFHFVCSKIYDYGQDFHFYYKTKCKAVEKTLEQRLLKELKAKKLLGYALSPSFGSLL